MSKLLSRLPIDPYILAILTMVGLASLEPARGVGEHAGLISRSRGYDQDSFHQT